MKHRVTINDIARKCDVSRATVSLVLRNSPLVAAATRTRVRAEIDRQGYVYNRAAANLRQQTSSSVALVVNDQSNPFSAEFAAGVDEALGGENFVTLLGSTNESVERQQRVLASLMEHSPAGIMLSPAEGSVGERLRDVVDPHTPVLVFNREPLRARTETGNWDYLAMANRHGASLATSHLLALGHRRIASYGGRADSSSCRQRRQGYTDAMTAAGMAVAPQWLVESAPTRLQAAGQVDALLAGDPVPTAAVCYNDAVALGMMLGLAARGIRPGHEFAVTGFDDIPEAQVSVPPLTTLAANPRQRGREAAEHILARVHAPRKPPVHCIADVRLATRASTCPPPAT